MTEGGHCSGAEVVFQLNDRDCRRSLRRLHVAMGSQDLTIAIKQGSETLWPCALPDQFLTKLKA